MKDSYDEAEKIQSNTDINQKLEVLTEKESVQEGFQDHKK